MQSLLHSYPIRSANDPWEFYVPFEDSHPSICGSMFQSVSQSHEAQDLLASMTLFKSALASLNYSHNFDWPDQPSRQLSPVFLCVSISTSIRHPAPARSIIAVELLLQLAIRTTASTYPSFLRGVALFLPRPVPLHRPTMEHGLVPRKPCRTVVPLW